MMAVVMKLDGIVCILVVLGVVVQAERLKPSNNIFFEEFGCESTDKFAIIVHGWKERCNSTEWIQDLKSNLTTHRGGCIMCMDYSKYSLSDDYFGVLVPRFEEVVETLLWKLLEMEANGFNPATGFLFGFSFGAQTSLEATRRFGYKRLERIDVCEPAGPGFDSDRTYSALDPKYGARNVQCIHTSSEYGTYRRECHQDWNMGNCGRSQVGARPYPYGNHGLCPVFYNSAFNNEFRPVEKPEDCRSFRAVENWPVGFRMGYFLDVESGVSGDLFAPTTKVHPYNEIATANEV